MLAGWMVEWNMLVKSLELLAFLLKKVDLVCFIALIERYFKHILAVCHLWRMHITKGHVPSVHKLLS